MFWLIWNVNLSSCKKLKFETLYWNLQSNKSLFDKNKNLVLESEKLEMLDNLVRN